MKYANETGSGVTKHIPSFMQIGSGIQNLIWEEAQFTGTQKVWRLHKNAFIFKK